MPERIGFIGLGEMGSRIAPRLGSAGHSVIGYDVNKQAVDAFVRTNKGRAADSLADIAENSDIVISVLPNGYVVHDVFLKEEGGALANKLKRGSVVIDMSSAEPHQTRELAGTLAERGISLIDTPMSGGITGAEQGKLVLMVGADDKQALARVRPVLDVMSDRVFELGGTGSGHVMKSLNNYIGGTGFLLCVEALVIGRKYGLDPSTMVDVLNESTGRNFATVNTLKQEVIPRTFGTKFALGLLAKDVRIAADLAEDLRLNAPLTRLSRDLFSQARDRLGGDADHTAAVKYWELLNGMTVSDGKKT
jgi:3-hydroxyisobutyrate dehydrogenase